MFKTFAPLFLAVLLGISATPACRAAETTQSPATELDQLVQRIRGKFRDDPTLRRDAKKTEAALATELKDFEALFAKYQQSHPEDAANILLMQVSLYESVLDNREKAAELTAQLLKDFPDSKSAQRVRQQQESEKIRAALKPGAVFPGFDVKDLDGKPLSLSQLKGKVVLIDFWATWCGPCVAELPHVKEAYEKHHAAGFEIVGISLDRDRTALNDFLKKHEMTWPQYFDGKGWQNELGQKYGIRSIPATFLLDAEGKIIASDLRGDALESAVAKALKP